MTAVRITGAVSGLGILLLTLVFATFGIGPCGTGSEVGDMMMLGGFASIALGVPAFLLALLASEWKKRQGT